MALKNLEDIKLNKKLSGAIPSGFKSGDSDAELIIAEPLIEHPEMAGLYRAFDPDTGWRGWVEYTPPVPIPDIPPVIPQPIPEDVEKESFLTKYRQVEKYKELISFGILAESNAAYIDLKDELASDFKPEYLDII